MTGGGPDTTSPGAPRVAPLPPSERDDDVARLLAATLPGADRPLGDLNLFATFARHPSLFRSWLRLGAALLDGLLPARDRELLILRTAFRCRCAYEWDHHVRIGRGAGIDVEGIGRIVAGPDVGGWDPHEAALLRLVDELHDTATVTDATWNELARRYDDAEMIEALFVVGEYQMLAFALNAARVARDTPRGGPPPADLPW
ncbi:MAG: carboxymuconolactone decarboxylase family protein [Acidimicrobiia bacterium]|nr:carboxymuconolactone decarboxylase family protein [Acidimicrobiia bacterium]